MNHYRIRVNGVEIYETEPKKVLSRMFEMFDDIEYWSYDALRKLYKGVIEELAEYARLMRQISIGKTKTSWTRFQKSIPSLLRYISKDRDRVLEKIQEHILSADGLSRLRNFGLKSNKTGEFTIKNAEWNRMTDKNTNDTGSLKEDYNKWFKKKNKKGGG